MNTHHEHAPLADEPQLELLIQRCADGELDEAAERGLLARLEFQPDGWRRLALSFVELRVLSQVCRQADSPSGSVTPTTAVARPSRRRTFALAQLGAIGAALLAAFTAGRFWPHQGHHRDGAGTAGSMIAAANPDRTTGPEATAEQRSLPSSAPPHPAMFVNWSLPGSPSGIDVPVYSAPAGLATWQPFTEPSLSRDELEALRKAGYQVSSQREVLRLQSPDGHTVMLPVEALNVRMSRY